MLPPCWSWIMDWNKARETCQCTCGHKSQKQGEILRSKSCSATCSGLYLGNLPYEASHVLFYFPLQLSGNFGFSMLYWSTAGWASSVLFRRSRILSMHRKRVIDFNISVLQRLTYKNTMELDQAIKSCHPKCVSLSSLDKRISFLTNLRYHRNKCSIIIVPSITPT